jgi:hypothetical protein
MPRRHPCDITVAVYEIVGARPVSCEVLQTRTKTSSGSSDCPVIG